MKKRLLLIPLLAAALFVGIAVSPGGAVADTCAAGFIQDASACGGSPVTYGPQRYGSVCLYWTVYGDGSVNYWWVTC